MPKSRIAEEDAAVFLELWEEGYTMEEVAEAAGYRSGVTIRDALERFGLIPASDTALKQWFATDPEGVKRTAEALSRIDVDALSNRRHLPMAQALPHVKPTTGKAVVQSERQRRQDRLATSLWRAIVRQDLQRSGLLPR